MYKFLLFGLLVATAAAVPAPQTANVQTNLDCFDQDSELFSCVFVKAVNTLNRAARSSDIQLFDGLTFIRDAPMERSGKSLKTELEIMNELPRDTSDRTLKLVSMLYESAMSFMKSHSLKLSMPEEGSISRALDEGRAKMKKMFLPLIAAVGVKLFALVPILLGSLGLLVVKALFVGKIALLLAGVLAFQKLFGSSGASSNIFSKNSQPIGGWYDGASQGWSAGASAAAPSQGYYKRSFNAADGKAADAHMMAYSAQVPAANQAQ